MFGYALVLIEKIYALSTGVSYLHLKTASAGTLIKLLKAYIFLLSLNSTLNHSTQSGTKKKTVMICDDEQDLLQLFGQALRTKYNVILVNSGETCIEKFIEEKNCGNRIHLILLDYRLSDMLGDSVARKIKVYNGVKIILISAYNLEGNLVQELKENNYITKFIEKPIHLTNLIDLIADTIC